MILFIGSAFSLHSTDNSSYKIITYKELDDIVKQSGFTEKKITFVEAPAMKSDGFAAVSQLVFFPENPEMITRFMIPEVIPNVILIPHTHATPEQITRHASIILHEIGHIAHGHLDRQPIRFNILMLALVSTIALAKKTLTRKQERQADQFMLEKSTKKQLEDALDFFAAVQKEEQEYKKPFSIPWNLSIYTLINSRLSTHSRTKSRIKRIQNQIKKLQD